MKSDGNKDKAVLDQQEHMFSLVLFNTHFLGEERRQ
jgi:hypothetical protein